MKLARRRPLLQLETLEARDVPATYYVATSGLDNPSGGSSVAPWATLQFAANRVTAGDTVIVKPGDYVGFHLTTDGTASQRITFRGEPGARVTTRNATTPDGINLEGADYITVEGFTVINQPRTGIRSVNNQFVTIRNNVADANTMWGILTGFSQDLLIEGNRTSNSAVEHGIYVSNSCDRPTIRGNTIYGNNGNGIHLNGDASLPGGTNTGLIRFATIENNVIYNNGTAGGSGINGDGLQSSTIRNNLIYGAKAGGISLYRIDAADGAKNNVIVNNTVITTASTGRWALNITNASTGNTVRNNIFYTYHSFRGSITISADSLLGFTSDYNVIMNRFSTNDGNSVISLSTWRTQTGQDNNSFIATPSALFINESVNDYRLSASSPARDTGTLSFAPAKDIIGAYRPSGSGVDIGAYEGAARRLLPPSPQFGFPGLLLGPRTTTTLQKASTKSSTPARELSSAAMLNAVLQSLHTNSKQSKIITDAAFAN